MTYQLRTGYMFAPAMPRVRNPDLVLIGVRLMKRDIAEAKRIGQTRAIPYQHVIRAWVAEKAERTRPKKRGA